MPEVLNEETDPSEGLGITLQPGKRRASVPNIPKKPDPTASARKAMVERQVAAALARKARGEPDPQADFFRRQAEQKEIKSREEARLLHGLPERVVVDDPVDLGEYMEKDFATQLPWERGSQESRKKIFTEFMRQNDELISLFNASSPDEQKDFIDDTMSKISEHPKYAHLFRVMVEPAREETYTPTSTWQYVGPKTRIIPAKYRPLLSPDREKIITDIPELGKSENDPVFMAYYLEAMQKYQKGYVDWVRNKYEGIPFGDIGRAAFRGAFSASYGPIASTYLTYEGNKYVVKMGEHEDFSEENVKERANEAAHFHLKAIALQKGMEGFEPNTMSESIAEFIGFGAAFVFDPLTKMLTKPGQMVFNKGMIKIAEKRAGKSLGKTVAERQTVGLLAKTQTAKETLKKIPGQFGKGAAEAAAAGVSYGALTYQEPMFPAKGERWESFMGKVGMDATVFALFGGTIRSSVEALRLASPLFYKTRVAKDMTPKDVASIETKWTKQRELGEELRRAVAKDPKSPEVNRIKSEIDKVHLTKHEGDFLEKVIQELKVITDAGGKLNLETMRIDYTVRTPRGWTERVPGLTNLKERARVDLRKGEVKEPPRTERPVEEVPPTEKPMPPQEPPAPTEKPPPLPEEPPPLPQPKQPPAKVEEPNQAALEARVDELFTLRQSLRTAEGSFPAKGTPEREEFDIVQAELKEAKDAAKRGDSTPPELSPGEILVPIRIHSRKQNAEVPEDDMELTAKLIEQIISVAPDAETAIRNVHAQFDFGLGNARNNNLFNRYVKDRFNPDAPTVGTNKSPFTEWLRVGRGEPAKVEEPPPLPEVKQPPAKVEKPAWRTVTSEKAKAKGFEDRRTLILVEDPSTGNTVTAELRLFGKEGEPPSVEMKYEGEEHWFNPTIPKKTLEKDEAGNVTKTRDYTADDDWSEVFEIKEWRSAEAPAAPEVAEAPPAQKPELTAEELEVANFLASPQAQKGAAPKKADRKPQPAIDVPVNVPPSTSNGPKALIKGKPEQGDALYKALDSVTSKDEARYVLGGAHMNKEKKRAEVTDGRSLLIIPAKVSKAGIFKSAARKGSKVGDEIEGRFPNVDAIIPDLEGFTFDPISVTQLWKTVDGVKKAQRHLDAELLIQLEQGGKKTWFVADRLWDVATALKKLGYEKVELGLKDAESPLVLRADGEIAAIIMPVRREGEFYRGYHRPVSASELAEGGRPVPKRPTEVEGMPDTGVEGMPEGVSRGVAAKPATPQVGPEGKPISKGDLRRFLVEKLNVPVRLGVGRKKVRGFFRRGAESIRLKSINDIPTLAHEIGHYLHWSVFSDVEAVLAEVAAGRRRPGDWKTSDYEKFLEYSAELTALGGATSKKSYSAQQVRMEGVAEFLRHWLHPELSATAKAPKFEEFFEEKLATEYPDVLDALKEARRMYEEISKYPARAVIDSMIVRGIQKPKQSLKESWRKMVAHWYDEMAPIHKKLDDLVEAGAPKKEAEAIARDLTNHIGGTRSRAEFCILNRMQDMQGKDLGPGLTEILDAVPDKREFDIYLVAGRAIEYHGRGMESGIPIDVAREVFRDLKDVYEPHRKKLLEFQGQVLDLLVQSGVLNRADVAKMKEKNKMYVPFYRFFDTTMKPGDVKTGTGLINVGNAIRHVKGSDAEIMSPITSIVKNVFAFWEVAVQNDIALRFTKFVEAAPGGGRTGDPVVRPMEPITVKPEEAAEFVMKTGLFDQQGAGKTKPEARAELVEFFEQNPAMLKIWRAARKGHNPAEGIYSVWENGKQKLFEIDDPELYQTMLMTSGRDLAFMRAGWFKLFFDLPRRTLRAGAVVVNPEFPLMNFLRSEWQAMIYGKHRYIPLFNGIRGILQVLGKGKYYKEFMKHGGAYSSEYSWDADNTEQIFEDILSDDPGALALAKRMLDPRQLMRNIEKFNEAVEYGPRVEAMRAGLLAGDHPRDAANAAKEIGLNHTRMGKYGRVLNSMSAFWNATMLDMGKFLQQHVPKKLGGKGEYKTAMIKGFTRITLPTIALWMLQKDNERIRELPWWQRQFFWCIDLKPIGVDWIFKWPKPFLWGQVYGSGPEMALEAVYNDDPDAINEWVKGMVRQLPGGWDPESGLPLGSLPDSLTPSLEALTNYSFWSNRPVVPESMEDLPPHMQWTANTSEAAKVISLQMYEWFGDSDNDYIRETFGEWSPMKIDHMIRGHFAGGGRASTDFIDFTMKQLAGDNPEAPDFGVENLPVIGRLKVREMQPARQVNEFYEAAKKMETMMNGFRNQKVTHEHYERNKSFIEKNEPRRSWYMLPIRPGSEQNNLKRIRDIRTELNMHREHMQRTELDKQMSGQLKAQELLRLKKRRDDLAKEGLKLLHPRHGGTAKLPEGF